jgi:hypothetical protein
MKHKENLQGEDKMNSHSSRDAQEAEKLRGIKYNLGDTLETAGMVYTCNDIIRSHTGPVIYQFNGGVRGGTFYYATTWLLRLCSLCPARY